MFLYNHEDSVRLAAYQTKKNKKIRNAPELNSYRKFYYYWWVQKTSHDFEL